MNKHPDMKEVLITNQQIKERTKQLAEIMSKDYKDRNPLFICILKGAAHFYSELTLAMTTEIEMEFMVVSSYGSGTETTGEVQLLKDVNTSVKGRDIVVVEDIVDTGVTLNYLLNLLYGRGANSVQIASLLSKPSRRKIEIPAKYIGFEVADEFVVGYGLDYNEKYRNVDEVCVLKNEIFTK